MSTFAYVVNALVLWGLALWACFRVILWLAERPRVTGRRRRRRGYGMPNASPAPNLITTFTTRRTERIAASSSLTAALGSQSADTATLLREAARNRLTAPIGSGDNAAGDRGRTRPEDAA